MLVGDSPSEPMLDKCKVGQRGDGVVQKVGVGRLATLGMPGMLWCEQLVLASALERLT